MWAVLIPAIVAFVGALTALIRVETANKTATKAVTSANQAQNTANIANARIGATKSDLNLAYPVMPEKEGTMPIENDVPFNGTESEQDVAPEVAPQHNPPVEIDGAALMGVRAPVTDPEPVTPDVVPEPVPSAAVPLGGPSVAPEPPTEDRKARVLAALDSLAAAIKNL